MVELGRQQKALLMQETEARSTLADPSACSARRTGTGRGRGPGRGRCSFRRRAAAENSMR